ncbi:MAG: Rrf2 family transcriptional regulator [SAR324 cluster bacterium]|uniref:Rrf2 family transcriptional regulator n=1 Tax=SAR324 cluster bacterium TaxID=2024889 RepID=A0A7X9IJT5_9DELT|nr:Rrf2 family transcriptional regulator [SAR324 cluster bacterium]
MKLSSRSEYALLALVYIARSKESSYLKAADIAQAQGIPLKFLEQILLALKRSSYLKSSKGQHGGYKLLKEASRISVAEIIRLFDGALAPTVSVSRYFYESTPIEKEKKIVRFFKEIRDDIARRMEKTTIADLL